MPNVCFLGVCTCHISPDSCVEMTWVDGFPLFPACHEKVGATDISWWTSRWLLLVNCPKNTSAFSLSVWLTPYQWTVLIPPL